MTPAKAVRKYCLACCNGSSSEVKLCPVEDCALHPYRLGKAGKVKLKNIRQKCLDCSSYSPSEVKNCEHTECSLFDYRFGHNPKLKGKRKNNFVKGIPLEKTAEQLPI